MTTIVTPGIATNGTPIQGYLRKDGDKWVGTCDLTSGNILTVNLSVTPDYGMEIFDPQGTRIGYTGNSAPFIWQDGKYEVEVSGYGDTHSDTPFTLTLTTAPKVFPRPANRVGKPITVAILDGADKGLAKQYEYVARDAEMMVLHTDVKSISTLPWMALVSPQDQRNLPKGLNVPMLGFGDAFWQYLGWYGEIRDVTISAADLPNPGMKVFSIYYRKGDAPPYPAVWKFYDKPRPCQVVDTSTDAATVARVPDGQLIYGNSKNVWMGLTSPPQYLSAEGRMLIANSLWGLVS